MPVFILGFAVGFSVPLVGFLLSIGGVAVVVAIKWWRAKRDESVRLDLRKHPDQSIQVSTVESSKGRDLFVKKSGQRRAGATPPVEDSERIKPSPDAAYKIQLPESRAADEPYIPPGPSQIPAPAQSAPSPVVPGSSQHDPREDTGKFLFRAPPGEAATASGPGEYTRFFQAPARSTSVEVFYATDRAIGHFTGPGDLYLNDRDSERALKFGVCAVSIPDAAHHKLGRLESPSIWRLEFHEDPEKHVVLMGARPQSRDDFFGSIRHRVTNLETKELLVFVHGYNVSFEDAARRTGQLAYDLQFQGVPILYSWPSRADAKAYPADETNVAWSVPQLRSFLLNLCRESGATIIHLIAHSMGNRLLVPALNEIALQSKASEAGITLPLFRHVVLTAPDIDADTFRDLAAVFRPTAHRVTLYSCSSDRALALSRTFHGYPRAGDSIVIVPGIEVIDASTVDTSLVRHSYFAENRSVISDIFSLLRDDKPPEARFGMSLMTTTEGAYYTFRP